MCNNKNHPDLSFNLATPIHFSGRFIAYPTSIILGVTELTECETKKKLIVIENCLECPYVRTQAEPGSSQMALYCTHPHLVTGAKFIINLEDLIKKGFTIPSWCPLEDYAD